MSDLQILGAPASNFVWMVRIACTEKGVPYTLVPALPHTPEIDAIHPLGKIPSLRHGKVTLAESRAICLYIDRTFDGPPLVPADPIGAARAEQWLSLVNVHIDPVLVRRYVGAYVFPRTDDGEVDRATIDAALPEMRAHLHLLDNAVAATGCLAGTTFTLADMNLLPILYYMNKLPESRAMLSRCGHLNAYFDRHMQRPSVRATVPESMPPAFERAFATLETA